MRKVMHMRTGLLAGAAVLCALPLHAVDFGVTGLGNASSPAPADPKREAWEQANQEVKAAAARGDARVSAESQLAPVTPQVGGYTLGAGDRVRVTVFNEETLSGEFEIDGTGVLAFPLAGDVRAGGLTARQLEKALVESLSDGYLVNPRVSVEVLNFRPFFIYGEVREPGAYPYVNGLTVINAVALAGGYTPRAKTGKVSLRRSTPNGMEEYSYEENAKVLPGDVIQVKERFF